MKLLHVVPTYVPAWRYGGPIRSVHGLCKALVRRGHEVAVATTDVDGEGESGVPTDRPVDVDGVRVHYFPSPWLRRIYWSPRMGRFLDEHVPSVDLVHTHSVFLWPTTAAASAARRSGVPYVVSPRGMLVPELIRRRSSFAKKAWIALFERRNIERAAAIHATSPLETRELGKLGLSPQAVFEVPNGVDRDLPPDRSLASAAPAGLPQGYALFLGRINWKKGLEKIVDGLALQPDLVVVVAGNDEDGYQARLEAQAARLGVASRLRFAGFVDGAQKAALIENATAVILPSDSENFGNSLLEAMALGTPAVATPGVGLADVIEKERCGMVVAPEARSIGEALRRLKDDDRLRAELGANARKVVGERYSWDAIAAEFEKHYRSLVQPCGR